jgi:hypothetical protein
MTANHYNNAAVEDPMSPAIRCFEDPTRKPSSVASVVAGSTIGIKSSNTMGHPGPVLWYMAKVPEGQSAVNWKGDGNVWFKFQEKGATIENSMVKFETGKPLMGIGDEMRLTLEQECPNYQQEFLNRSRVANTWYA